MLSAWFANALVPTVLVRDWIVDGAHPVVKPSPWFSAKLLGSPCDAIELFPALNSPHRIRVTVINQMRYLLPG